MVGAATKGSLNLPSLNVPSASPMANTGVNSRERVACRRSSGRRSRRESGYVPGAVPGRETSWADTNQIVACTTQDESRRANVT